MKVFKRLGTVMAAVLVLAAVMTGTALAAEPENTAAPAISVQLNGQTLAFTDASPESSNGRTFVPLRAVMEAMDAQVDYERATDTVKIQRGGVDLSMVLGDNKAVIQENGQTRTMEMDVVPYVKNDRTYVPVRFVAEAFGCNVGWDQSTKTVIIVDVDALMGDAAFTLMDNFSAYCAKQNKTDNMAVSGTMNLNLTDKSGVNFTKPVSAAVTLDGIGNNTGAQLSWELQFSGLADLLADSSASSADQVAMQQLLSSLSSLKGEVRMDLNDSLYLTLPAALTGAQQDTWYSVDMAAYQTELFNGLDMTQLAQLQSTDIREALAAVLKAIPLNDSASSYDAMAMVSGLYVNLMGDQAFTQSGSTYVSHTILEDLVDMTITLTKRGDDIVSAEVKAVWNVDEDGQKMSMTMEELAAPDKVTLTMEMTLDIDQVLMAMDLDLTCVPTSKAPVTLPPAGATVVPMN